MASAVSLQRRAVAPLRDYRANLSQFCVGDVGVRRFDIFERRVGRSIQTDAPTTGARNARRAARALYLPRLGIGVLTASRYIFNLQSPGKSPRIPESPNRGQPA